MDEILTEADELVAEKGESVDDELHANLALQNLGLAVRDMCRAQFAVTLDHAEHDGLISAALRSRSLFTSVFVLLLAAHERGVSFDNVLQRCREQLRCGAKA